MPKCAFKLTIDIRFSFVEHTCKLAVMIAQHKNAPIFPHQRQHEVQAAIALWTVIDQIPELDDKTLSRRCVTECLHISMHIADDTQAARSNTI